MADAKSKNQNENRDGLALIIGGLLVLALVFGAYSYFNRRTSEELNGTADSENILSSSSDNTDKTDTTTTDENSSGEADSPGLGDRIRDFLGMGDEESTPTDTDDVPIDGDLNGEGASPTSKNVDVTADTATGTGGPIVWTANDYDQGDISGTSYTVKDGDTLWEIAEARYGNGADWTRILDANTTDVGFLPNGQHALIEIGQTLVLPN